MRVVELAEGRHGAVGRIVLGAGEVLENHLPGILELVVGETGTAENVGIDRQGDGELPRHHRPSEARMARRHRLRPLDARAFEDLDDVAARAVARAAEHHFAGERRQAAAPGAVMNGAGGGVEGHGHRLEAGEVFAQKDDAIVERGRMKGLFHSLRQGWRRRGAEATREGESSGRGGTGGGFRAGEPPRPCCPLVISPPAARRAAKPTGTPPRIAACEKSAANSVEGAARADFSQAPSVQGPSFQGLSKERRQRRAGSRSWNCQEALSTTL